MSETNWGADFIKDCFATKPITERTDMVPQLPIPPEDVEGVREMARMRYANQHGTRRFIELAIKYEKYGTEPYVDAFNAIRDEERAKVIHGPLTLSLERTDMKTPERAKYELAYKHATERAAMIAHHMNESIHEAAKMGVVVTVETVPLNPPAMGRYDMGVTVRPSRATYEMLESLKKAAMDSEALIKITVRRPDAEGEMPWYFDLATEADEAEKLCALHPYLASVVKREMVEGPNAPEGDFITDANEFRNWLFGTDGGAA